MDNELNEKMEALAAELKQVKQNVEECLKQYESMHTLITRLERKLEQHIKAPPNWG